MKRIERVALDKKVFEDRNILGLKWREVMAENHIPHMTQALRAAMRHKERLIGMGLPVPKRRGLGD